LADSLFTLGVSQNADVLRHFRHVALVQRLQQVGKDLDPSNLSNFPRFLQCLGSASLIGVTVPHEGWTWLEDQGIAAVIGWNLARCINDWIGVWQIRLWLGLREAARMLDRSLRVPREAGERTLELWRNATPSEPRRRALDAEMIAWLSRCGAADWTLLPEPQPIFDLLHGQD
jgi:hypothetical protein